MVENFLHHRCRREKLLPQNHQHFLTLIPLHHLLHHHQREFLLVMDNSPVLDKIQRAHRELTSQGRNRGPQHHQHQLELYKVREKLNMVNLLMDVQRR